MSEIVILRGKRDDSVEKGLSWDDDEKICTFSDGDKGFVFEVTEKQLKQLDELMEAINSKGIKFDATLKPRYAKMINLDNPTGAIVYEDLHQKKKKREPDYWDITIEY